MYVLKVLGVEAVFYFIVVGFTMGLLHTTAKRTTVVGVFCLIFNIAMYAMPLDNMVRTYKSAILLVQFLFITTNRRFDN